jgi:sugar (pentulose or hexulose) kinase
MDPGEADRVVTFLMTPDLVSYFLTGEKSCEYYETSTPGLVDAHTRDWAGTVLTTLPFDRTAFPRIVAPGKRGCTNRHSHFHRRLWQILRHACALP